MTGAPPGFTTGFCDTDICEGCNPVPEDPDDPQQVGEWSEVIDWSNDSMTGLPAKMDCAGQMGCDAGPGFLQVPTHAVHLPTKKILFWGSALDQYLWDIDNETFEYVPADSSSYGCAFEQDTIIECSSEQDCYDYCDQYQNGDCPDPLVITDPLLDCVLVASAADLFCAGHTHHTNAEPFVIGGNVTGSFGGGGRTGIVAFDGIDTWTNTGDSTAYTLWYPSVTTLPDGRVLVFGGDLLQNSTGLYNPSTGAVQTTVNHPIVMNGTKLHCTARQAWLALAFLLACGPSVGSGTAGESSNGSASAAEAVSNVDVSWAVGTFTMPKDGEPAGMFVELEIPEEGRAVATRYDCDRDGGPSMPYYVTPLEWRAISESVLEVIPPVVGEKFLYGSEPVIDLFIERPTSVDGILVYSSQTNDQWPYYGNFVHGRACEYYEGGRNCPDDHYYRICSE